MCFWPCLCCASLLHLSRCPLPTPALPGEQRGSFRDDADPSMSLSCLITHRSSPRLQGQPKRKPRLCDGGPAMSRRRPPPTCPAGALLGLWTLPPPLSLSDAAPRCAATAAWAPRPGLPPSPLGPLQDLSPLLGGKQLRSPGVGQAPVLSQPRHPGSVVVLGVCKGARASSRGPRPIPAPGQLGQPAQGE